MLTSKQDSLVRRAERAGGFLIEKRGERVYINYLGILEKINFKK
jgi:hypothetical protein